MKKFLAPILSCLLCFTAFVGCSSANQGNVDPVVVDVRIYKAGYGTEWFHAAKEKFEALYQEQGYSINIVEESNSVPSKVLNEIQQKKSNKIDLYITGDSNFADLLKRSESVLKSKDETLLENLNDVFSSPAIKFDGSEESVTIESKLNDASKRFLQFQGTESSKYSYLNKFRGNYYAFPWASGVSGFFANKSVFDSFGLELPRTTDELLHCYDVMCPQINGKPTPAREGVYPMIYAGQNGSGFWLFPYDTFFAQYSGVEAEKNFWLLNPANGKTSAEEGYKVYDDQGILEALKVVEKLCNDDYCVNGTSNMDEVNAELNVLQGKAAIMPTGNWVYAQMKLNYSQDVDLDKGVMMKMPVISKLGVKLGISDETLSLVIKGVDDGKTDAVIASECGVSSTIAARVREARNIYFDYSTNHIAYIPSYSTSKDVAKLFLRFLASDDNLDLYKTKAYSALPFKYAGESKAEVNTFVASVEEVMGYGRNVLIAEELSTSAIRQIGLHCFPYYSAYDDVFKNLSQKEYNATTVYENNRDNAEDDWSTYRSQAGLNQVV